MIRRTQPPVVSTVAVRGLARAVAAGLGRGATSREALARALAHRFSGARVVLTDSGTSALVLALRSAVPNGGTVALPGYACIDLSAAAVATGVRVRLYDVDPRTLAPDLESLGRALRRGVDAVVVAYLYGFPIDVPTVQRLAAAAGAHVIEDAAQAAGGTFGDALLGSFGPRTILSFGRGKGVTGGGGGALVVHDEAASDSELDSATATLASMRTAGWPAIAGAVAQWMLARPRAYAIPSAIPGLRLGEMVYHPAHEPGPIGSASAALALDALGRADAEAARRRAVAQTIAGALDASPYVRACEPLSAGRSGYLRLPVRAPGRAPAPPLGVLRGYPATLEDHTQLRPLLIAGETAGTGAAELRDHLFTIPTHGFVTRRDIDAIAAWAGGDYGRT